MEHYKYKLNITKQTVPHCLLAKTLFVIPFITSFATNPVVHGILILAVLISFAFNLFADVTNIICRLALDIKIVYCQWLSWYNILHHLLLTGLRL